MVSALFADALASPTGSLLELFTEFKLAEADDITGDFPSAVSKHFASIFEKEEAFLQIPPIDVFHPIKSYENGALVRFRAMIQDNSVSPEFYLSTLKDGRCGGWGISEAEYMNGMEFSDEMDWSNVKERSMLWATNIPSETQWCSEILDGDYAANMTHDIQDNFVDRVHKFPFANVPHVVLPVKIYDRSAENMKTSDVVNFVGILRHGDSERNVADSDQAATSPTLHVLFARPLPKTLLTSPYPSKEESSIVRQQLTAWLASEALGGDIFTAEWVLLACISSVQSWKPLLAPPALTITHFPKPPTADSIPAICHVLSLILPLFSTMPLSLNYLNLTNFAPKSIDDDLHAGVLQLPGGTLTVVTETNVQEGELTEKGIHNVQVLRNVIKSQELPYEFPYNEYNMSTDLSFIFITEGDKSIICETEIAIPLDKVVDVNVMYKDPAHIVKPSSDVLTSFRNFIIGSKCGAISISDEVSEYIQADFVQERRQNSSISADDLTRRMSLARLMTLSQQLPELTRQIWRQTKDLDLQRSARFHRT